MKKILRLTTTLILLIFLGGNAWGQTELLVNGGFESWDNSTTPTGWDKIESVTQEGTEVHGGTYSAKHIGGRKDLGQFISVTGGKSYTITMWYKVVQNDGTDARIWSYWRSGGSNLNDHASELRGPNDSYLDNNSGVWTEYTVTLTAPASADEFYFEVRTYSGATVYWDDFSFLDNSASGPADPNSFTATASSTSQIVLSFATNVAGDNVIIVFDNDNTFSAPAGTPPAVGQAFAGGTLLYNGTTSPQNHTGLSAGETWYYKAWSVDGSDEYSTGIEANATTLQPTITVSPSTLTDFTYVEGSGPSGSQNYSLSGSNLTPASGDITITPSANYEVSLDNSSFSQIAITKGYSSGTLASTPVYVRLKEGLPTNSYNSELIANSGGGATTVNVTCSGSVTAPPAPDAPVAISATVVGDNGFTANWNTASGATGYYLDVYTITGSGNATDLFISEYGEGSGNNKYIEIYNGTGSTVDLSEYVLKQSYNGGGWSGDPYSSYNLSLSGTLANNDVYVIANSGANASILAQADIAIVYSTSTPGGTVVTFTGNDAMGLFKNGVLIDVFGDPLSDLTIPVAGFSTYGQDHTIVRKSSINAGNTDWTSSSGTNTTDSEWIGYAQDTWTYLGSHTMDGGSTQTYVSGYENLNVSNVTTYAVTSLSPGTTYFYVVRAYNAGGASSNSNEIEVITTGGNTPPSIDNIVQTPASGITSTTTVSVSADVTDAAKSVSSVELHWGTATGSLGTTISMTNSGGDTYTTDSDIPAQVSGTTVYYEIEATDDESATTTSLEQSYFVVAAEPTNHPSSFGATANSSSAITVNWTDADPAVAGYLIKGSHVSYAAIVAPVDGTAEANSLLVQNVASGVQTHQFTGLAASTTYFFKIYPYNGSGTTINYKTDGTIEEATATTDASLYSNGDFGFTTASGTWGTTNTNWKQWDGSGWNTTPAGVPSTSDNVFILAGNTCSLDASGKNCKNLTVESTAKLFGDGTAYEYINVYGNITCDGTIGNGATLDGICFNIEGGTCTISGAGDFDASRIRKNTSTNATTGLTINMNINLRYGGTALYSAVSNSTFDVTLNNGSTLALPGDGATLGSIAINGTNGAAGDRGGSITVNGTLNVSDIFYLFSNASTLPASVTIGSSGIVNVNQVLCSASGNAGHTFTINSGGKLNFNGSTADVWGTYSTTNNTYTFNTGSIVEYSYAGAQTIKSPANYSNLIVSGAGTKTLGENTIVDNDLTIQSGSVLVIPIANSMTVSGILTNSAGNAGLVIKSDASGTGSLIHSTAGVNATMERFMNNADWGNWQDGWHFLSSPVLDQAISPAFTTDPAIGYDFFLWNEPTNEWINYKNQNSGGGNAPFFDIVNGSNNFAMGRGYMAAYDEADTKEFSGALNVADVSRTGLGISSGLNKSWHLLGNPFSSALTWDASGAWSLTNISGVAKIWNEVNQSYSDLTSSPSTVIPATNGFMVQVSSGTGSLTLPSAKRAHDAQAFYKSTVSDLMLTAKSHEAGNAQESRIIVNPEATTDFDLMLDGEFLSGYGPLFYSVAGDLKLSTNSLPQISAETEIPFNFIKNEGTQFSITASGFEGLSATPYLIDLKTGSSQNLIDQPVYNFTAAEGDVPNRFLLKFGAVGIGDNIATEQTSIYSHGQIVYISSTKSANALISIYNITGQQVYTNTMVIDGQKQITLNTPTGWYIVKVRTQQGVATQKVFIKSNQ